MGSVYEAVQDTINRRVALKILHPQHARDPELVRRFLNEARAANLVSHPAMVQVSECDQAADGTVFLVMEYLEGVTLASRLQQRGGRLSEGMAVSFAWQLAAALAAAHDRAIVHRDLKPGNVMLVKDPAMPTGERIKLLDFGIAKLGQEVVNADGVRTRTGVMMGTPLYMAPEQCLGFAQVDGKADVYSLGVMLFQMLAGVTPFAAGVDLVLLNMHVCQPPPSLRKLAPEVSELLARLVQQMLSKNASDRPTMKAVAQLLHAQAAAVIRESVPDLPDRGTDETAVLHRPATTLNNGTGQLALAPRHLSRLSRAAMLVATGLVMIAVPAWWIGHHRARPSDRVVQAVTGTAAALGQSGPQRSGADSKAPLDPGRRSVRWRLTTQPPGAQVVEVASNAVVGITPWTQEHPAQQGVARLALILRGHRPRTLLLNMNEDVEQTELLDSEQPLPRRATVPAPLPLSKPIRQAAKTVARKSPSEHHDEPAKRIID